MLVDFEVEHVTCSHCVSHHSDLVESPEAVSVARKSSEASSGAFASVDLATAPP